MTTTLEEDEIAELSDDPDELQAQLEAITGGAGAVFQVNGFRGGRLPNRNEIRQVRFRTNSFAADNHDAGRVQVEIITRPGLTEWSGNANFGLRTDVLNARNAFARTETPEQFRRFTMGLRGPLVRNRTSLRFNVDGNRSFDSGTIVALRPDGRILDQVRRPVRATNVTVGSSTGSPTNQTFRFEYRRSEDARRNLGVGDFNLLERAYGARRTNTRSGRRCRRSSADQPQRIPRPVQRPGEHLRIGDRRAGHHRHRPVQQRRRRRVEPAARRARSKWPTTSTSTSAGTRCASACCSRAGAYRNFDARNAAGTFTFGSLEAFRAGHPNTFTQRLGQVARPFRSTSSASTGRTTSACTAGSRSASACARRCRPTSATRSTSCRALASPRTCSARRPSAAATASSTTGTTRPSTTRRCAWPAQPARSATCWSSIPAIPDPTGGVSSCRPGGAACRRPPTSAAVSSGVDRHRAADHTDVQRAGVLHAAARPQSDARAERQCAGRQFGVRPEPASARSRRSNRPAARRATGST